MDVWCLEDWEEKFELLTQSIGNKAVCRTASATPGLLIIIERYGFFKPILFFVIFLQNYVNRDIQFHDFFTEGNIQNIVLG